MVGLRQQATADLKVILENSTTGFGWPLSLTDPSGNSADLIGSTGDIALVIDPQTGQAVSGRTAHVALALESLTAAGLGIPVAIAEITRRPWVVEFDDPMLNSYTFKVSGSHPDRTLGLVTLALELYTP